MSVELRPYQIEAHRRMRAARKEGHRRILVSAPTGSGKSVLAVAWILGAVAQGLRVLIVAHRKELIDQFYVHLVTAGITPGILRGDDERTDPTAPVQVGTIQTLSRRDLPPADIVFVDEAHRCPGDSYAQLLSRYPKASVFGLTATPARLDGKPLKEQFDTLVQVASYSQLIDAGAIVAPIVYRAKVLPNLAKVKRSHGDYDEGELEEACMGVHVIGDVVKSWLERAGGRQTVVYAVGIEHSLALTEEFRAAGVRVAHLDGTTPIPVRDQILVDLYLGKLQMVCNVGVLTEGWDCPPVKCCVRARPTLSLTLWMQCAGRILRPWNDTTPLLLDHSGNVERHFLPHMDREWSLEGKVSAPRDGTKYHLCAYCYAYVDRMPCPLCGHTLERQERKVVKRDGVLEEVKAKIDAAVKAQRESDPKRAYFDEKAEEARKKGFKPGYAAAKWKEKHGNNVDWPPWAWSQALKADYAADTFWQERVAKREREREFWKDRQKAAEDLAKTTPEAPPPEEYDDGIPF